MFLNRQYIRTCLKLWNYGHLNRFSSTYDLNLAINNIPLDKFIHNLEKQYETRKNARFEPVVHILKSRRSLIGQIKNLEEFLVDKDVDIAKMATEEKSQYEKSLKSMDENLLEVVLDLSLNQDDSSSIVLEVNAGIGGQEAMLFAYEVFHMYIGFIQYKAWDYYIAEMLQTDLGGIRHGSIIVNDRDASKWFKYEAGVHRVQRIPSTEKAGRIHTSTVSVLALPQPTEIQIELQAKDLKIETKRATGAGGQHVNTTDSAVRIVHLPTGFAVECQTDRSQIRNKAIALQRLRAKLYDAQLEAQLARTQATKTGQVRSNYRNEKIRTYNYSQDRITDHRLRSANVHNMRAFMLGGEALERLIDRIRNNDRIESLLKAVLEFNE